MTHTILIYFRRTPSPTPGSKKARSSLKRREVKRVAREMGQLGRADGRCLVCIIFALPRAMSERTLPSFGCRYMYRSLGGVLASDATTPRTSTTDSVI